MLNDFVHVGARNGEGNLVGIVTTKRLWLRILITGDQKTRTLCKWLLKNSVNQSIQLHSLTLLSSRVIVKMPTLQFIRSNGVHWHPNSWLTRLAMRIVFIGVYLVFKILGMNFYSPSYFILINRFLFSFFVTIEVCTSFITEIKHIQRSKSFIPKS